MTDKKYPEDWDKDDIVGYEAWNDLYFGGEGFGEPGNPTLAVAIIVVLTIVLAVLKSYCVIGC